MTSKKNPPPLPTAAEAKWNAAAATPNTPIDLGDIVVCDACNTDYRGKHDSGGFIFQSKAVCPLCAPRFMASVVKYGEQSFIRATCPDGVSFHRFVLDYRGDNNSITVFTGEDADRAIFGERKP